MIYGTGNELHSLELALEAGGVAWWMLELPHGAVFFSPNKAKMLGYESSQFKHYTDFTKLLQPDDYDAAMSAMMELIKGKTNAYEVTYRILAKDGTYKLFLDRGKIVGRDGDQVTVAGIVIDADGLPR